MPVHRNVAAPACGVPIVSDESLAELWIDRGYFQHVAVLNLVRLPFEAL